MENGENINNENEKSYGNLEKTIINCYLKKVNVVLIGKPGVGKTNIIYNVANLLSILLNKKLIVYHKLSNKEKQELIKQDDLSNYFVLVDIKLQSADVNKFSMFILDKDFEPKELISNDLLILTKKNCYGILLFDEINMASPQLQSILFEIFLNKKISQYVLSDGVMVIGTGNRYENIASNPIPKPLLNRVLVINFDNYFNENYLENWINWAINNNIDKRIISFVKLYGLEVLYDFNEEEFEQITTPRSYELISKLINNVDDIEEIKVYSYGLLSKKVANKFITFITLILKLDLDSVINNNVIFTNSKIDEKVGYVYLLSKNYKNKDKDKVVKFIEFLIDNFTELATLLILLNKNDKDFVNFLIQNISKEKLIKFGKYL
ncbi:MAG: AAA family ATPase [Candidatus Omnitrophica bacterium]|nr:AAA family ATPase [Candidatus Omnitrophota bacterium]